MNREKFLALTPSGVSNIYSGKRDCCRCACRGNYIASSNMENPRSEVNDSLVARRLKRAQALVRQGADVDYGDTYVDVQTGRDRTLTFYVDELKK